MNRVEVSIKICECLFLHVRGLLQRVTSVKNLFSFEPFVLPTRKCLFKALFQITNIMLTTDHQKRLTRGELGHFALGPIFTPRDQARKSLNTNTNSRST